MDNCAIAIGSAWDRDVLQRSEVLLLHTWIRVISPGTAPGCWQIPQGIVTVRPAVTMVAGVAYRGAVIVLTPVTEVSTVKS